MRVDKEGRLLELGALYKVKGLQRLAVELWSRLWVKACENLNIVTNGDIAELVREENAGVGGAEGGVGIVKLRKDIVDG